MKKILDESKEGGERRGVELKANGPSEKQIANCSLLQNSPILVNKCIQLWNQEGRVRLIHIDS